MRKNSPVDLFYYSGNLGSIEFGQELQISNDLINVKVILVLLSTIPTKQ